jgi:hypothetical protein
MPELLRDQYLDYMTGRNVERPLLVELFGPLVGLDDQWRAQGASEEEIDLTAFGFDYVRLHTVGVHLGFMSPFEREVIEETNEHRIERDHYGRKVKLCKGAATIALPLEYPVANMDDWRKLKSCYEYDPARFDQDWAGRAREARDNGALIRTQIPGGFDEVRQLMGDEAACIAYYEQPELMHDILETIGKTTERILDEISAEVTIDQLSVHEDMAGKSGPLAGPVQVREFIGPYYRRNWDVLASRGATIFEQDSDGNMNPLIDAFLETGLNCMHPFEPAAGMDMVATRKRLGDKLMIRGGIDKHVLRRGHDEIRAELEYKLQPCMRTGGIVFGLDHRIPNGTPLENYRYYVRTAREILGLEPNPEPGWARMAF